MCGGSCGRRDWLENGGRYYALYEGGTGDNPVFLCLEYEDVAPKIRASDLNVVWHILFDGAAVICDRVGAGFVDSNADLCEGGG